MPLSRGRRRVLLAGLQRSGSSSQLASLSGRGQGAEVASLYGTGQGRGGLSGFRNREVKMWSLCMDRAGQRWPLCMERGRADVASLDSGTENDRGVLYAWKRAWKGNS